MAPVAAAITIESRGQRLGIGMKNNSPGGPVFVSSIAHDGLFASCGLQVGMQVLSINNIPVDGMTPRQAIQILKDIEGQVVVVADNPIQAAVVYSGGGESIQTTVPVPAAVTSTTTRKSRGYIIMKKTFKYKPSGFQMSTEKSYSFHGPMSQNMVDYVNEKLRALRLTSGANRLQFKMDDYGHFRGVMNHQAQKHHEEDFVVVMLEAMEELGYHFRFQYDAETFSTKMTGDSYTSKELFIFHKMQDDRGI